MAKITPAQQQEALQQLKELQRKVDYDTIDFTVDYVVKEFRNDKFFIPGYQRKFIWPAKHKTKFIESVLLGLPIPMLFLAEMGDGRLEIVDGAQRVNTLVQFVEDDLKLSRLETLTSLNGFKFSDIPPSEQGRFGNRALRMVILEESTSLELREAIFERINWGPVKAKPSEVRKGAYRGPFYDLVQELAKDRVFLSICPLSDQAKRRGEAEELVLRFFAYSDSYKAFRHDVEVFLNSFIKEHQRSFDEERYKKEFRETMDFVKRFIPNGFAKSSGDRATPRVRFEALAVGTNLALRRDPKLVPQDLSWLNSDKFAAHTTTHASNSQPRLAGRIEFVRDQLLRNQ